MKEVLASVPTQESKENFLVVDQFLDNADAKRRASLRSSQFFTPTVKQKPSVFGKYTSMGF